jgi:hypothetical protein
MGEANYSPWSPQFSDKSTLDAVMAPVTDAELKSWQDLNDGSGLQIGIWVIPH